MKIIDLTGRRFGRWTVLAFVSRENRRTLFRCRCDCGTERDVLALSLTRAMGASRGCGCVRPKPVGQRKHGGRGTREYRIWKGMRDRCNNPSNPRFVDYGGAGVKVCALWDDFAAFLADMGRAPTPQHTLDRRDNSLGYSPDNCRWATQTEQQRNRTNNKLDEARAAEIRALRASGRTFASIASDFDVSKKLVMDVVAGRAWSLFGPTGAA